MFNICLCYIKLNYPELYIVYMFNAIYIITVGY